MVSVNIAKPIHLLFRELPYNGIEMRCAHGQFNNALQTQLPTKKLLSAKCSWQAMTRVV